jgi:hypothetical protein
MPIFNLCYIKKTPMFSLSTQANIVLWIYIIQTAALSLFILIVPFTMEMKAKLLFTVLILMAISGFLTVYGVNCMIVGDCQAYAWVITGLIIVSFVASIVDVFVSASKLQQAETERFEEQKLLQSLKMPELLNENNAYKPEERKERPPIVFARNK